MAEALVLMVAAVVLFLLIVYGVLDFLSFIVSTVRGETDD